MTPWWAVQSLADEHRRALMEEMQAHRVRAEVRAASAMISDEVSRGESSDRVSVSRDAPTVNRRVGAWLIRAGTRLGGATIQTS